MPYYPEDMSLGNHAGREPIFMKTFISDTYASCRKGVHLASNRIQRFVMLRVHSIT